MARFTVKSVLFATLMVWCLLAGKGDARPGNRDNDDDDEYSNDEYKYDYDSSEKKDDDDKQDDNNPEEEYKGPTPTFNSVALNLTVKPGSSVAFPCDIDKEIADSFAIMWKKNNDFLYTEGLQQTTDRRFTLHKNRTLSLVNVGPEDSDVYICEISNKPPVKLVHTLRVPSPAMIKDIKPRPTHGDSTVVNKGTAVTLMCTVSGYPKPEVKWIRKNRKMPSGLQEEIGSSITFESVNRHHEGTYECIASNSEKSVHKTVELKVHYVPEISIEKEIVSAAEGFLSELICTVHAQPAATVEWLHDGKPVMLSELAVVKKETGGKHILQLKNTTKDDFGAYVCRARNSLGTTEKVAKLSGFPNRPMLSSTQGASDGMGEIFEWTVESSSPISEYKLEYRKKEAKAVWVLVQSPIVENPEGNKYTVKHKFSLPTGEYEVVLKAKNTYGWSEPSKPHPFTADYQNGDEAPKMPGANTGFAESSLSSADDTRPRMLAMLTVLSLSAFFL